VSEIPPVKIFASFSRFVHRPEPPTSPAAPFDDGLAELARLIAREDREGENPVNADARRRMDHSDA
jgi:hypothetical protein